MLGDGSSHDRKASRPSTALPLHCTATATALHCHCQISLPVKENQCTTIATALHLHCHCQGMVLPRPAKLSWLDPSPLLPKPPRKSLPPAPQLTAKPVKGAAHASRTALADVRRRTTFFAADWQRRDVGPGRWGRGAGGLCRGGACFPHRQKWAAPTFRVLSEVCIWMQRGLAGIGVSHLGCHRNSKLTALPSKIAQGYVASFL